MRGQIMKIAIAKLTIAALAVALTAAGAQAQGMGGHRRNQQSADKTASPKPKADEKAYNNALNNLPNKPYDPWHIAR
jgi:hypothetical protein